MIKLSVNETKWSSLLARTRALILYILIWIYDFGPVKLPGLSRSGPQNRCPYPKFTRICIWGLILDLALIFRKLSNLTEVSCRCDPKFLRRWLLDPGVIVTVWVLMKVTVNFHNDQLKEVAQEGAPKVDRALDKFCICHSVELAILKLLSFIANWNISCKHTLLRRGCYWYLIHKILSKTVRVINACGTTGKEKGAVSLLLSPRPCLHASFSPLLGLLETQRDLCEEEKNVKLQVNALRKQSLEWVYFYSRTSLKRPPDGCQDLVVAYGRWSLTRIGQQRVFSRIGPVLFGRKFVACKL